MHGRSHFISLDLARFKAYILDAPPMKVKRINGDGHMLLPAYCERLFNGPT